jgi:hypothetical protein
MKSRLLKTPKNVIVHTSYFPDRVRQVRALLRVLGEDDSDVVLSDTTDAEGQAAHTAVAQET